MSNKLIGTDPNQVPSNADLGTLAYQDADNVNIQNLKIGDANLGTTPSAWLTVIKDNDNSGNQVVIADAEGASPAAIRTYSIPGTSGDPAGLILNHYYAVEGSGAEYMRYADFVANVGNGAGTTMRFITKNAANTYSTGLKIDNNGKVYVNSGYNQGNFGMYIQGKGAGVADARALHVRGYGGHTTIGGTAPTLVLQNADSTTGNITKLSFETASNGEAVSINCFNTDHGNFYGDMAFNTRGSTSGYSEKMRIMSNGNVGIGTTNPAQNFVVASGTNGIGIELVPGNLNYIQAYNRGTSDYSDLKIDAQTIQFGVDNGSEAARFTADRVLQINATKNYGSGSTYPSYTALGGHIHGYVNGSGSTYPRFLDIASIGEADGSKGGEIRLLTSPNGSATGVERVRINQAGNVGIGTDNPGTKLSNLSTRIANADGLTTNTSGIEWALSGQGYIASLSNTSTAGGSYNAGLLVELASTDATDRILDLESGGVNRVRVLGNGNVGIGNDNPTQKLDVVGGRSFFADNNNYYSVGVKYKDANNAMYMGATDSVTAPSLRFSNSGGGHLMAISYTGGVGIGTGGDPTNGKLEVVHSSTTLPAGYFRNSSGSGDSPALVARGGALNSNTAYTFAVQNYNGANNFTVDGSGIIIHNGVSTYSTAFYMTNNIAYNYDINVGNEGGNGNVIEVHAMYEHFYNWAYGASLITLVGKRGTNISQQDIKAISSGNGGSWTISAPDAATLRVTKTAGTYNGAGWGHLTVRFRKS